MTIVSPGMVRIKFIKDATEVRAKADGGRRTIKYRSGTEMDVKPRSAAYWCESMNVAERVKTGARGVPNIGQPVPGLPGLPPLSNAPSDLEEFEAIRDGLEKQEFEAVYAAFLRLDEDVISDLSDRGLTSDNAMILEETIKEIGEKHTIETISITDLRDAIDQAMEILSTPPKAPALPKPAAPLSARATRGPAKTVSKK